MKRISKVTIILFSMVILAALSGCQLIKSDKTDEKKVTAIKRENLDEGYYILKGEDKYYPISNYGLTFSTIVTKPNSKRVAWWTDGDKLIPTLKKGVDRLVYFSKSQRLSLFSLEEMEDYGYSIGIKDISYDDNLHEYYFNPYDTEESSNAGQYSNAFDTSSVYISNINDATNIETYVSRSGTLLGLEKNKGYDLGIYYGTVYKQITLIADTRIMASYKVYSINKFTLTKNGYQVLEIPEELPSGYYCVDGLGLFYYDNPDKAADYTNYEGDNDNIYDDLIPGFDNSPEGSTTEKAVE